MRFILLLAVPVLLVAESADGWPALLDRLDGWSGPAADWQRLVPAGDPGGSVEPDAREAWLTDHEQRQRWQREPLAFSEDPGDADAAARGLPTPAQVADDPDRLIPVAASLVAGNDRALRDLGVRCLIPFHLGNARADALRPLLPWLDDPAWSSAPDRLRLVQSLDRVRLPEAEPALLRLLVRARGWERRAAADALAALPSPAAVPTLRRLLAEPSDDDHAWSIARAFIACGGVDEATAIMAVAASASDDRSSSWPLVGLLIARGEHGLRSETVAAALAQRAAAWSATPADVARGRALCDRLCTWPVPTGRRLLLEMLRAGTLGDAAVAALLGERTTVVAGCADGLRVLAGDGGPAGGAAAALLGGAALEAACSGSDAGAARAACTFARLLGAEPPSAAATLLSHAGASVRGAAETWLRQVASPEARRLLFAAHPGEMVIVGRLPGWDPGHATTGVFADQEDLLRARLRDRADPPVRIHALLSAGYWGGCGQLWIEEHADHARLVSLPDPERRRERRLTSGEWSVFRTALATLQVERLPAAEPIVYDGIQYEHVELAADGGYRVWMNNPQTLPASPWDRLVRHWDALRAAQPMPVAWPALAAIPGASVLFDSGTDPTRYLDAVDAGDGIRVLHLVDAGYGQPRREEWRMWTAAGIGEMCAPPGTWPAPPPPAPGLGIDEDHRSGWRALLDGGEVVPVRSPDDTRGLWWLRPDRTRERLATGWFAEPIAVPDTRTVVAARAAGGSWAPPWEVVAIDAASGAARVCGRLSPGRWRPLAWSDAHRAVLLIALAPDGRAASDDPAIAAEGAVAAATGTGFRPDPQTRAALWEPASDTVRYVDGVFEPLLRQDRRPLQPITGRPGRVWATLVDGDGTRLVRYDLAAFRGETVAVYPGISFTSDACVVDAAAQRILVCRRGDLLALPLPNAP